MLPMPRFALPVLLALGLAACTDAAPDAASTAVAPDTSTAVRPPVVRTTADDLPPEVIPPGVVTAAFAREHAAATGARWTREEDAYEVAFTQGGTDMAVIYTTTGETGAVETKGGLADLPAPVQAAFARRHAALRVLEAATIVEDGETTYEIAVDSLGRAVDFVYLADGTPTD